MNKWVVRTTYSNGEPSGMAVENQLLNITLTVDESPLSDSTYVAVHELVRKANR